MTDTEIIVRQYGLLAPLDWSDDCEAEIDRMRDLWNKLVEIDRMHRDAIRAIGADDPVVIATSAQAEAAQAAWAALMEERSALRKAARKKLATPEMDAAILEAAAQQRAAWAAAKEARQSARAGAREQLRALEDSRKAAVKAARQSSGCFWGGYNAVIASYETARHRAIKEGAELRFRSRHKRDCRIVNQIQGGGTWAEALDSTINGQVSIRPHALGRTASGRARPEYRLTATIYTRGRGVRRTVTWPLILHRPMPENARIQEVTIVRQAIAHCRHGAAARETWSVSFLCRVPAVERTGNTQPACGIDIGWRRLNDGVRVAVVVPERGERTSVVLPERIVDGWRYSDDLAADIDRRTTARFAALAALPWGTASSALQDMAADMRRAPKKTYGMLDRLVSLWRETAASWEATVFAEAARDVQANRRDVGERHALMRRLAAARKDHYRKEALRIARNHGTIGLEANLSLKQMAESDNDPTPPPSRQYRKMSAPSEFLSALRLAADKTGAKVIEHDGASTWVCAQCGHEQSPSDPAALIATCPSCSATWDQDVNAARIILATAVANAATLAQGPAALAHGRDSSIRETRWQRARRLSSEQPSARE